MRMQVMTNAERYSSVDKVQGSLVNKVFLSTYLNLAILVILSSGRVDNAPAFIQSLHILQGTYYDFEVSWYGTIGTYFITSFALQAASAVGVNLFMYYIYQPYQRYKHHESVR